jgi:hypothetical protein
VSKINCDDKENTKKEFAIDLDEAELDWGKYCLGSVFGNVEWKYE